MKLSRPLDNDFITPDVCYNESMIPGKYNMICPQGATFSKRITWKVEDVPVNLTTYTARMQARTTYNSATKVVDLTTENGGIALDSQGNIDISIAATATAALTAKEYVYDLELINGTEVSRLIEGKFIVTPEVTK